MKDDDRLFVYIHDTLGGNGRGFSTNVSMVKAFKLTDTNYISYYTEDPSQSSPTTWEHDMYETGYVLTGFKTLDGTVLNLNTVYTIASLNNNTNITSAPYDEDPTKTEYTLELNPIWELDEDLANMGKAVVTAMYLKEIANAVRAKNGASRGYKLSELPAAIRALNVSGE